MKQNLLKSMMLMLMLMVGMGVWAEEVVYKTALFGSSYNSGGVSSYTGTFSATNNGFTVNIANFNNNNNGWNYVKTGNKSNASVGTITTNAAIDKAVTKVAVTIDAITATSVNSITLYSGTSSSNCTTNEGTFSASTGTQTVTISSPAANKFYKISFDCKKGSSNGLVTVSKVEYYYDNSTSGGSTPANPYTVTFNAGTNGTCLTSDLTETSAGAGVTLPDATPSSGYKFVGWSTSETPTSADAGKAGDTYKPNAAVTLYAYYKQLYAVTIETPSNGTLTVLNNSNAVSNGDEFVAGDILNITATPASGYKFRNIQVVDATTHTFTASDTKVWEMGEAAVTISANFDEIQYYTINYMVNGVNTSAQENIIEGTALAFPTPAAINGKQFMGWSEIEIDGRTNTAPSFVNITGLNASANKTYYAVFANVEEIPETWNKVTDVSSLSAGDIITFVSSVAVDYNNGSATKQNGLVAISELNSNGNNWIGTGVTAEKNVLVTTTGVFSFTLHATSSQSYPWAFKFVEGETTKYIYAANTATNNAKNYLKVTNDLVDAAKFSISISNGVATITANGGAGRNVMKVSGNFQSTQQNGKWNNPIFNCYASNSEMTMPSIYKKEGGNTYSAYCTTVIPDFVVTTADNDFYSLYLDHAVTIPSNVTAFTGQLNGNTLSLTEIAGGTIPANTGVVFKTDAAGKATFVAAADVDPIDENDIKGVATETVIDNISVGANEVVLVLGMVDSQVGFAKPAVDATTLAANKAYIIAPTTAAKVRMVIGGETAIKSISTTENGAIFNLAGQRVGNDYKGIVIKNGKKVLNK